MIERDLAELSRSDVGQWRRFFSKQWADDTASAERECITGVLGGSPQRGPGAEPLVRGAGGEAPPQGIF